MTMEKKRERRKKRKQIKRTNYTNITLLVKHQSSLIRINCSSPGLGKLRSRSSFSRSLVVAATKDTIVDLWFRGPFVYCSVHIYIYSSSVMLPVKQWRQQITCHLSPSRTLHRRFPLSWHARLSAGRAGQWCSLDCNVLTGVHILCASNCAWWKIGQKRKILSSHLCSYLFRTNIWFSPFHLFPLSLSLTRATCSLVVNYDHYHRVEKWKKWKLCAVISIRQCVVCVYL